MFESIAPDMTVVRQDRSRFFKVLPASLLLHGVVLVAVPSGAAWRVELPTEPPRMMVRYNLADVPPPPPPPPPPAAPKARPVPLVKPTEVVPEKIVAPTVIPDEIVPVTAPEPVEAPVEGIEGGVEGGIEGGVAGGVVGGVEGGVIGGTPGGVVGAVVDDSRVHIGRDEKLGLEPVFQDYPIYPGKAQKNRWQDRVVVRYVIGTNGRVKDVTIVESAQHGAIFDEATLEAIRKWRFRPMVKDGKKVEVVHELTVFFKLRYQNG